ncbi:hypothetical protein [Pantoea sp. BAV 3049]|uniref:hypothetical protein n=1 Tax=Pantoea sp. BAV 3049 TaxID=2654188 RepID=UPI00131BF45D|nr:hypothetical protein [Pantoea sp. BAV 3049]
MKVNDVYNYEYLETIPKELVITNDEICARLHDYVDMPEISDVLLFLTIVPRGSLDGSSYLYIRSKIEACLNRLGSEDEKLFTLRELSAELDCFIF